MIIFRSRHTETLLGSTLSSTYGNNIHSCTGSCFNGNISLLQLVPHDFTIKCSEKYHSSQASLRSNRNLNSTVISGSIQKMPTNGRCDCCIDSSYCCYIWSTDIRQSWPNLCLTPSNVTDTKYKIQDVISCLI